MDTDRQAPRSSRRRRPRRSHAPLWLVETIDTVRLRSRLLLATAAGVTLVGILAALLAPSVIPPVPIVGAALGFAAVLLGLAVAIAVDAADLRVRGPRHVRAAGGELVAILPPDADPATAGQLAAAALDARGEDAKLLMGLAAVGDGGTTAADLTDTLAIALATEGVSVLRMDLARGASEAPGLFEVANEQVRLARAASFESDIKLAWLPAGSNVAGALNAIPRMIASLPRDLDVLVVAFPAAASRQVVRAAAGLDHVLLVAERDATSRVELIAALDAFDAAGCPAQVVLVDARSARWLGVGGGDVATPDGYDAAADDDEVDADVVDAAAVSPSDEGDADGDAVRVDDDGPVVDADEVEVDADDPDGDRGASAGGEAADEDPASQVWTVPDEPSGDETEAFVSGVRILSPHAVVAFGAAASDADDTDASPDADDTDASPDADDTDASPDAAPTELAEQPAGEPVGPRDVSVMVAAAQAAALADAEHASSPGGGELHHEDDVTTAELPLPPPVPARTGHASVGDAGIDDADPPEAAAGTERAGGVRDDLAETLADTDELAPIVVDADDAQDDPLLTTAQLSALIDEVESRDERR